MQLVKKNLFSIICGVVAILAVVGLIWPSMLFSQVQTSLNAEQKSYNDLSTLKSTRRHLPGLQANGEPPVALEQFPNAAMLKDAEQAKDLVHDESGRMLDTIVAANRHDLLLPDSLPKPASDKVFGFRTAYQQVVQTGIPSVLHSVTPPDQTEIDIEAKKIHDEQFEPKIITITVANGDKKEINRQAVEAEFKTAVADLPSTMREARAKQNRIYLDRNALSWNPAMAPDNTPRPDQIWFAQQALWIEQDTAQSIANANANATSILDAPIKRLLKLDVPQDEKMYVLNTSAAASGDSPSEATPGTRNYGRSPTGRVSNSLYDVIQFDLVIDVDARQIPLVIKTLEQDRLVTVVQTDLAAVDGLAAMDEGYVYGDVPVVRLTMQVETLFMRAWTSPLMPDEVKQMLHIPIPAGTDAATAGPMKRK